ncbi:hypothetical protein LCGC14_0313590 [marine sediment metagenome]|uniref:Uncharacterized protein n=1 Tax=marine sediment metagenome TaxID=412755 RepID=A0A0F9U458_9ZZZZ
MTPKREGRALPPDTPPERHGVITLNVKAQGANLNAELQVMGDLTIGEIAVALEFRGRMARQQVGAEAAKAELLPMVEKLQHQAETMEKAKETPPEVPVGKPPDLKRPRRSRAKA